MVSGHSGTEVRGSVQKEKQCSKSLRLPGQFSESGTQPWGRKSRSVRGAKTWILRHWVGQQDLSLRTAGNHRWCMDRIKMWPPKDSLGAVRKDRLG